MGTYMEAVAQKRDEHGKWVTVEFSELFQHQSYRLYGWLCGVRNYSGLTPLLDRWDTPEGFNGDDYYDVGITWVSTDELLAVDYDQIVEDRRCMINNNGGSTCEPGQGETMTLREFLGEDAHHIQALRDRGIERIVLLFSF